MPRKYAYLVLFVIGTVVPYLSFVPWVMDHGFDISRMVEELFANRISAFFGLDVVVSAIVLWVFIAFEGQRKAFVTRGRPSSRALRSASRPACRYSSFCANQRWNRARL